MKEKLLGKTLEDLREVCAREGLKTFAAKQMAQWLYVHRCTEISQMTNLSKSTREKLEKKYTVGREQPLKVSRSIDGTAKYLFSGAGSLEIESVMIPDRDRATLCVSSQAGCRMNCKFCMTGRQGFHGNLDAGSIINQVLSIDESSELTNIVFMGMGEPTDNLTAVLKAIDVLTSSWGLAWSPRRITVSTIGNLEGLRRLLNETQVNIAISVHTPFSAERRDLMPVEGAFPVTKVMELLKQYDFSHQRRLSVEYTMWNGRNDDMRHAVALARIIEGTNARVNLIRFHKIPGFDGAPSSRETMEAFRDKLNDMGIISTIRASRGEDIEAACGMLAGKENPNAVQKNTI